MVSTIQKWGNSQGIRIPKVILDKVQFSENEAVEVEEFNGNILIKKVVKEFKNLDEMFENYSGSYVCTEYDFGEDVGLEKI